MLIAADGFLISSGRVSRGLAQSGRHSQFSGGRVRVSGRRAGMSELRGEHDPAHLLAVAATAPAPAPMSDPPSRRQKVTVDA